MLRAAPLVVVLLLLLLGGGSVSAVELGLSGAPADATPGAGDFAPTLRSLRRELGRWERERVGHEEPSLSIEVDRSAPYRLSLVEQDGRLDIVAGREFVRDPVLFRTLAAFVLGLSRYDRYGQETWLRRLGLMSRTVWKHYFGARHLAEVVHNADQGSSLAQADIAEFWQAHVDSALAADGDHPALAAMRAAQVARLVELEPACAAARALDGRLVKRVQRRVADLRKRGVDLEKQVRADRRDQVADTLESIVPLADLEPFERAFWQHQLDLMRRGPAGRRVALNRALYSGKGYQDGEVILSPMARDSVEDGKPVGDSLVTYFRVRTARGQAWEGHRGIFQNFRQLDKKHTSVAINAMLANQASSSSSSPFISFADREFAEDFATRRRGERARVRAYDIPEEQVLVASHANWNEPELLKFLFVFPSDRHAGGRRAPTEGDVRRMRSGFNRSTISRRRAPNGKPPRGRRASR